MDETEKLNGKPFFFFLKEGDTISERYEVKKKIGSGGFADVYLVLDLIQGKELACKVFKKEIDEKKLEIIKREADFSQKITHENLLQILFLGKD